MKSPKISVIMPVFNTEKYVWEAIESILNQSFSDFEFIIIDDCSTDKSYGVCDEYAEKDKRIRLYRNEKNKGISFTRNRLINLSKTNFIATQDSDDISINNRLELCFHFLETNIGFWAVSWNNIIINEIWEKVWVRKYSNNIKNIILKKSPLSNPSSMFKKDIFLNLWWYDSKLNYWEDYDLWLKMYAQWYFLKNLDEDLIQYRIRKWQTKDINVKETLRNTIFIQKRAVEDYWMVHTVSDKIYLILEYTLLYFPNWLVIFLFKKIEY